MTTSQFFLFATKYLELLFQCFLTREDWDSIGHFPILSYEVECSHVLFVLYIYLLTLQPFRQEQIDIKFKNIHIEEGKE